MKKLFTAAIFGTLLFAGCSDSKEPANEEVPRVLGADEKADDFRSESAQEYYVRGTATLDLDATYATLTEDERLQRVRELIPYKQVAIGFFLNSYLIDKSSHDDNKDYGGFKALTKNGSYDDLDIQKVDELTYSFGFVQEIGGTLDLLQELGRGGEAEPNANGGWDLELAVGTLTNDELMQLDHENEWYRKSPWSSFNPETVDASKWYKQKIELVTQERSNDAWMDYERLFEDGALNVSVFFGWDYHDAYHQKHAQETYEWLLKQGFESPVVKWEDYTGNRAALTRTMKSQGKSVDVEVTLWWGEPGTETDPDTDAGGRLLEDEMRKSFQRNEVTIFSGHSGPWYGFALANWRKTSEGDLDDSEIPTLDMPADKYQVVLAEGCDTYALGEAFWANPAKSDRQNLDIITTTSFSNASGADTVTDFLTSLFKVDDDNSHTPIKYSELLKDMDSNSYWFHTMYGIHGIDNNPHSHPYGDDAKLCTSCDSDAACGDVGNKCIALDNEKICSFECTANDGCPTGYSCEETAVGRYLAPKYCVPASLNCADVVNVDDAWFSVFVNEVNADPAPDAAGDANGDGIRDASQDEFIEFYNGGDQTVDLTGWSVYDEVMVRYTFENGTVIEPGEHLVLFGGGEIGDFTGLPSDAKVLVAPNGLFLNNGGDGVLLVDANADVRDSVFYGLEGGKNNSLIRHDGQDGFLETHSGKPTPGAEN